MIKRNKSTKYFALKNNDAYREMIDTKLKPFEYVEERSIDIEEVNEQIIIFIQKAKNVHLENISKAIRTDVRKYNTTELARVIQENKGVKVLRKTASEGRKSICKLKNRRQNSNKQTRNFYDC